MNKEINALVLKTTPYKESSLLLTVLTKENGKQNILCRGVKKGRRGKLFAEKFAVFEDAYLCWQGRSGS